MFTTIINDCRDDNAKGRQMSRVASLAEGAISFVGVDSDIEAGIQLIDILDATEGRPGMILVNVAPRGGHTTKWENGTPFAYCWHHETLIISTVDGFALSGVKKFLGLEAVNLLDTHSAARAMEEADFLPEDAAFRLPSSQFRSFDFTPRVGVFLAKGNPVPSEPYSLENIPDLPAAIWNIDNFGNCKTTLTREDVAHQEHLETRFGTLPVIAQLRDVPDGTDAVTVGSSGIGNTRFLELVTQRKHFASHHGAKVGDDVFEERSHFVTATD
jgi:hypothetical protein